MEQSENVKGPDSTAVRTALWRALHVQVDAKPHILDDEIGLKLIAPPEHWRERPDMKFTKRIRASIVARARYIEDLIIEQSKKGICQYVILGSGLDTFAQRRPDIASWLQIFEIDRPDTLIWKQIRLVELGYKIPDYLHFVPVDFETHSWKEELLKAGFNDKIPAVVVCTGVTLYLTKEAIIDMLKTVKTFMSGSIIAITFYLPVDFVESEDKALIEMSIKGAIASGTPMIGFFTPVEILAMARETGFNEAKLISVKDMVQLYFKGRTDNLLPADGELFLLTKV